MTNILNLINSLLDIGSKVDPGDRRFSFLPMSIQPLKRLKQAYLHRPLQHFMVLTSRPYKYMYEALRPFSVLQIPYLGS